MSDQPTAAAECRPEPSHAPPAAAAPRSERVMTLLAITIPLLGVAALPFLVWGWGFHWLDLSLLVGMYLLTTFGITIGFHRLFVHRSFATFPWIMFLLAAFGSMAVQGSLLQWVGLHRRHHQFSDRAGDPHSPHQHGKGLRGLLAGFWHAHIGWFFAPNPPDLPRYVRDLASSRSLRIADRLFPVWVVLGLLLPATVGGLVRGSWSGFLSGLLWGGLVRVFLVHHVTWSVNSACHLWGMRPYATSDLSRNNPLFGLIGLGEGWHNTHHAFSASVRHGLRWWEIDATYWIVRLLAALHLAWDLRYPPAVPSRPCSDGGV